MIPRPFVLFAFVPLVALSAFAVQVGPETAVATTTIDTAPHLRGTPRVASNGTDFLVAWHDRRGDATEIRATRVDRDGNLLDAESLLVGADTGAALSVASDGEDYLVAYNCHPTDPGICVARVDAETGAVAHAASVDGVNPSLASNGNGYLLIHQSGAQNFDVRGRGLRGDGVLAGEPFTIGTSGYAPTVAANEDAYFVLWSTHTHLEGVLVSDSAVIGLEQRFTNAVPSLGPGPFTWSVASNGDDFFVAWQQNTGVIGTEYTTELRASRVSATGIASLSKKIGNDDAWQPHATWTGADYLVTYTHSASPAIAPYLLFDATGDIRAVTVSADGEVSGEIANIAAGSGRQTASAAASNDAATLVTWENQHRPGTARIESSLVPRGGNASATRVLSKSTGWQQNVVASRDTTGLINRAIAWDEVTGDEQLSKVYVQRYDQSGAPLDGRGISAAQSQHHQRRPVFGRAMIAWIEEDPVTGAASVWWRGFYAPSFSLTGPAPAEFVDLPVRVADAAPGSRVSISHAHVFHVLFWESPEGRIKGVRVSMFARIGYDPLPFYVSPGPGDSNPAAAATWGNSVLVTWNRGIHKRCVPASVFRRSTPSTRSRWRFSDIRRSRRTRSPRRTSASRARSSTARTSSSSGPIRDAERWLAA
ncbi:MAG TPA: hypothetical protein VGQ36_25605 [Thermoanaerobaculia bacterium]|nr:hypothetical protein [Thermoanaerobaculia bacterium]